MQARNIRGKIHVASILIRTVRGAYLRGATARMNGVRVVFAVVVGLIADDALDVMKFIEL